MPKDKNMDTIECKKIVKENGKVIGKECYDLCHKGEDVELGSENFQATKKEKESKVKERKEKQKESKAKKEVTQTELEKNQCGLALLTTIEGSAIRCPKCPKGIKAYKYHYDEKCRKIKPFNSTDPLVEARNYPMMFFSTQNLPAITPKQYKKLKKEE